MGDVKLNVRDDSFADEEAGSPPQRILRRRKNSLEAPKMRLLINMENGNRIPLATLWAQFALFTAILFVRETGFYAEYDSRGFKTALSYHISALLVSNSWRLSKFGFIRGSWGFKANTTANGAWLVLAILLEKYYEKSLSSLGFALSIAVSFLILLVIIRPRTDLGFFGFLIGVVVSVAYNLFGLKFRTWIVVAICILLLDFKSWLDGNWLEVELEALSPKQFSKSKIIEAVTVAGFYLVWDYNLFRTNFQNLNVPDSDSKSGTSISLIAIVSCVGISCVWLALILVPRVYLLFRIVRAIRLIQLILRKDKWWNKFLLKGNDSFHYSLNLALKLSLELVEDGVALLTDADLKQLVRQLEAQPRIVTKALRVAGLESANLILGIDFTKSNEWTGTVSFNNRSLHAIGDTPNPYEKAISVIGKTLAPFDDDNLIPCFGFGDATTQDWKVFSFHSDHSPCHGFEEVLACYKNIVPNLRLSGPTSHGPVIDAAIDIVENRGGQFHVLVIISDGPVTRSVNTDDNELSPQEAKTIDSIVKASSHALAIVLVGVGDGPWEGMKSFCEKIPARDFDNFQFVNFTDIMSKNKTPSEKETAFALAALMAIPSQYKAAIELGILGRRTGRAREIVPHPPPLPYTPRPRAPEREASNMSAPVLDSIRACPVCLTNAKDLAFGCGHVTCRECGSKVSDCPICRQRITSRLRLFA